jgi:hypothetical protein
MNQTKYILHTAPEQNEKGENVHELIKQEWFSYIKGWPTVTWNIPVVLDHATRQWYKEKPKTIWQIWNIFCMELPKEKKIKK